MWFWPRTQGTRSSAHASESQVPRRPKANAEKAHRTQNALARRKLAWLVAVVWEMPEGERERERERERESGPPRPAASRGGGGVPD